MLDTLTYSNREDFKARYRGTFGFYIDPETKEKSLCYITDVSQDKASFDTIKGRGFFCYADAGVQFEFLPVIRGWWSVAHSKLPYYVERVPARQFQRGISKANTTVFTFTSGGALTYGLLNVSLLESIFVKQPESSFTAFLKGNQPHFIINNIFLLHKDVVWFYDVRIGKYEITPTGASIELVDNTVAQELRDFIARKTLPILVKHV